VLDVSKLHAAHKDLGNEVEKPVIRTFYDHSMGVNDVAFHPNGILLASCSDDMHIKMYDLQRPNVKRGFRYFMVIHHRCRFKLHVCFFVELTLISLI
jgi:cleavage stimulation factor subunit 1